MGIMEMVRGIISGLRAAGKTAKEVSEIVEQAADRATVPSVVQPQAAEAVSQAEDTLHDALVKAGISAKEALDAFEGFHRARMQTRSNNWRKYHGLPMRRAGGGRRRGGKGKRDDRYSKDAGIS